ncbi:MAG: hypothetical protein ACLT9P_04355 [Evtepia gabavorous]
MNEAEIRKYAELMRELGPGTGLEVTENGCVGPAGAAPPAAPG